MKNLSKANSLEELNSIYNGGCINNPDICFVFMNPTGRNIATSKDWNGPRYPWIGTKNVWTLFYKLKLLDEEVYKEIREKKGKEWTSSFAEAVYQNVRKHKYFITNLGKCTQVDARSLPDEVLRKYLKLLEKEIELINPKVVIMFVNQVSSIILDQKISVSNVRKQLFEKIINNKTYKCYAVYYPVGNGIFNIDKSIEDTLYIKKMYCEDKEETIV